MKKIYLIGLGGFLALGIWLAFSFNASGPREGTSQDEVRSRGQDRQTLRSDEARMMKLSARSGIAIEHLDPCLIGLLEGYASTTDEGVAEAFQIWLEKDHLAVLNSLEHLDGLIVQYGVSAPEDLVAKYLLEHYSGEEAINLIGNLNQVSDVVRAVLGETLEGWGEREYPAAIQFLKERTHLRDYEATRHLLSGQVKTGHGARLAKDLEALPADDPRRRDFLESVYGSWVAVDPVAFAEFTNTLEDTTAAEQSLVSYVNIVAEQDPTTALEWAETLKDGSFAHQAKLSAVAQLSIQDPGKYEEWLSNQKFKDERENQYFLEEVKNAQYYATLEDQDSTLSDAEIVKRYQEQDRKAILEAIREQWGEDELEKTP